MTTQDFVRFFEDIRATDIPLVGGKGANLGELAHAGFPVPEGFCVTAHAFRHFMQHVPNADALYTMLEMLDPTDLEAVRRAGQHIRQTIRATPIPADIADAILAAWRRVGTDEAYAVRSSATAEDLPEASFAGQQETYLNVRGETALLDAVRNCWASLFTDRAILYRAQNNFAHRDVALAVVVQRMIAADVSGIMFTADPLTGHRHTLAIDASFGLGEALVSGLVTPDTYRVDKRTRTIIERRIAEKEIAIWARPDGGTEQRPLPPEQRRAPVLTDEEILVLADLGCRIEAHYGRPQDIEWAIAAGRMYILQARPITSLYPIEGLESPDGTLHVYFSMGHQQNMTRAMPPFSLSMFPVLAPIGRINRFENRYIRSAGGRLFADITAPLRHRFFRRVVFAVTAQFDALAPEALRMVMQRPEFQGPHGIRFSRRGVLFLVRLMARVQYALWRENLDGFVEQTNARIERFIADLDADLRAIPPGKALVEACIDRFATLFAFFMHWIPQFMAGEAAKRILTHLGQRWLSPQEAHDLSLAIPGNVVNEMNLAIGDLADIARRIPSVRNAFAHLGDDGNAWLAQVAQYPDSAEFLQAWHAFMQRYGARGPAEIDLAMPRWWEDPLPLLHVIAAALQQPEGHHCRQHAALVQRREAALRKLMEHAGRGVLGPIRRRFIQRLVYVMLHTGGMREHHKYAAIRAFWVLKQRIKAIAATLTEQGYLAHPDDIWFLTWRELDAIWDQSPPFPQEEIERRRKALARFQKLSPPLIITSDGETPVVHYRVEDAPPGALVGNPVSPGVVEGVVHIVHDPHTETLQPGEILVARFTDPGWTPLFINAAGLILEVGGAMNHGSIVAREYGIPAVVGVRDATKKLRTGQRVRLDGNRGIIEILETPEEKPEA